MRLGSSRRRLSSLSHETRDGGHAHAQPDHKLEIAKRQDGGEVSERRVIASEDGRVPAASIDAKYLEPDLESHALYAVRKLERGIEQRLPSRRGRYRVHMEPLAMEGVAQPEKLRRRLVRYLRPAFADSRELTRVHSAEMADGTLHGEVSAAFGESVELSLYIIDNERKEEVAAVNVKMSKADVVGSGVATRLAECAAHYGADRLPHAAGCYREVLILAPGNAQARAGLERIEARYVESARGAIRRNKLAEARDHVERLRELSPEHPRVPELEGEIAGAETLKPKMVRISGGCFLMGSSDRDTDEGRHQVCVEDFSIGKYEVTFEQWGACVADGGCDGYRPDHEGWGGERRPVINVSWEDANAYARWLSEATGERYRLPTEAEWEYAARAGKETSRFWGDDLSDACDYANVADQATVGVHSFTTILECWDGLAHTARVGRYRENENGLHDMLGNVAEWTCSEDDDYYGGAEQRCASGSAGLRVYRGGGWNFDPGWVRSLDRNGYPTDYRNYALGFRLAQD